ncbi:g5933 [Coccomyxa elongata]
MFRAVRDLVAHLPWWALTPTQLDVEIWRLEGLLEDLTRDLSAIEYETRVDFDPEDDNYRNIQGVKEVEGVTNKLAELRALRRSGGEYKDRGSNLPPKKLL